MNSRKRIIEMRDFYEKWIGNDMAQEYAAALRELDKLCAEYCEMIDEYKQTKLETLTHSMIALREDFRQAGY